MAFAARWLNMNPTIRPPAGQVHRHPPDLARTKLFFIPNGGGFRPRPPGAPNRGDSQPFVEFFPGQRQLERVDGLDGEVIPAAEGDLLERVLAVRS